jgi:hypothetical protein
MLDCPICKNPDHVYDQGIDPMYGAFILCSLHGIQILDVSIIKREMIDEDEEQPTYGSDDDCNCNDQDEIKDHAKAWGVMLL